MSPHFEGGVDPDSHRGTGWFGSVDIIELVLMRAPPHLSQLWLEHGAPPPQGGDKFSPEMNDPTGEPFATWGFGETEASRVGLLGVLRWNVTRS